MILIPSVDIINGKTVRLRKGKFEKIDFYDSKPLDMVKTYIDDGYSFVHIVNLDRVNNIVNTFTEKTIESICKLNSVRIQMGGGLRSEQDIREANNLGVSRFVLGTLAVKEQLLTQTLIAQYGKKRFTLAFDVEKKKDDYMVKTHAWKEQSSYTIFELINRYENEIDYLLCTDIDKDGLMSSPNFDLYVSIKKRYPHLFVQASGGVHNNQDLKLLTSLGVDGVVVGKAIHERKIDLKKLSQTYA